MPEPASTWTTDDFDRLSWHDCHVHGFSIAEGEDGTGELTLDVDFIVEWLCHEDRPAQFRIAPADLTFHDIFGLKVQLDYETVQAGMTPFSLGEIARERIEYPTGFVSYHWRLLVNWPSGVISFQSPGFTQTLRKPPLLVDRQSLLPEQRD
jgi:hypothetical protein